MGSEIVPGEATGEDANDRLSLEPPSEDSRSGRRVTPGRVAMTPVVALAGVSVARMLGDWAGYGDVGADERAGETIELEQMVDELLEMNEGLVEDLRDAVDLCENPSTLSPEDLAPPSETFEIGHRYPDIQMGGTSYRFVRD